MVTILFFEAGPTLNTRSVRACFAWVLYFMKPLLIIFQAREKDLSHHLGNEASETKINSSIYGKGVTQSSIALLLMPGMKMDFLALLIMVIARFLLLML